jgi:FkbM family methyltransferase
VNLDDLPGGVLRNDRGLPYYSQYGEDRWLIENIRLPGIGAFAEVGAADGRTFSNSLAFESLGWGGVVVEADPRRDLSCRKCRIERCAAASYDGFTEFSQAGCPDHSGIGREGTKITVPCKRLDTILDEAGIAQLDLLSIDTEGTELDVWASFDPQRYKPRIVIIEWNTEGLPDKSAGIIETLGAGYRVRHKTEANLIFERLGVP